jgi:HlyD family secretion protein
MTEQPGVHRTDRAGNGRLRRVARLGLVSTLGIAGAALLWGARRETALPEGLLYANGRLEAVGVRVSAEVTGRVTESWLVEGSRVATGDLLVRLDDTELQAALAEARAEAQALGRVLERIEHELTVWRHHVATVTTELQRARKLRAAGITSDQLHDRAEDDYEEARGRVGSLEAERRENEARLDASRSRVDLLQVRMGKATVRAPVGGTILVRAVEVGELATPGRVVAELADLEELELRVFVPQLDVGKVRIGSEARVRVDAFPDRLLPARVVRVDEEAQFTPREVHVPAERVRLVFGVTLTVSNPEGFWKSGMPADAWIRWKEPAQWPERLTVPG